MQTLSTAGGYDWILRLDAGRALVVGETPCLRVVLPARFGSVSDAGDVRDLLLALRDEDTLDRPLRVTYYLRFPGIEVPEAQRAVADEAAAAGWSVVVGQTVDGGFFDSGGDLVLMAGRTVLATPASVAAGREFFQDICRRRGCWYERWATHDRGYELR